MPVHYSTIALVLVLDVGQKEEPGHRSLSNEQRATRVGSSFFSLLSPLFCLLILLVAQVCLSGPTVAIAITISMIQQLLDLVRWPFSKHVQLGFKFTFTFSVISQP